MRTIFGTVFAAASVGCLLVETAFAGVWHKYEGNPVLGGENLGTCFDVNVVTNGPAPYTMYFSWRPKKSIALVRSDDAMKWTQTPEVCLEANSESGWEDDINRSCTVFKAEDKTAVKKQGRLFSRPCFSFVTNDIACAIS